MSTTTLRPLTRVVPTPAPTGSSRRLGSTREADPTAAYLCQPFDIRGQTGRPELILGNAESGYYRHTLQSALSEFDNALELGISQFCLRLLPTAAEMEAKVAEQAEMITAIRRHVGGQATLISDPFALAIGPDLKWGVRQPDGEIDADASRDLVAQSAEAHAAAGVDYYLTLGRLPGEVAAAAEGIARAGTATRIISFSTNSETPNAYIGERKREGPPADTGQKFPVGNATEMVLRGLFDLLEGTTVLAQKPIEGLHVVQLFASLLTGEVPLDRFLERQAVRRLAASPWVRDRIRAIRTKFSRLAPEVRLAAYTVSGTYTMFKLIEAQYGPEMAFRMLDERYRDCLVAGCGLLDAIIDRNAAWFLRAREKFGV